MTFTVLIFSFLFLFIHAALLHIVRSVLLTLYYIISYLSKCPLLDVDSMNKKGNMFSDWQSSSCKNKIPISETNVPDVMLAFQSFASFSWEKWKCRHGQRTHSWGYCSSGMCSCFTLRSESEACQIDLITQMADNGWVVMTENSFILKTWHQHVKLIHHRRGNYINLSHWSQIALETSRVQKSVPI